MKRFGVVPHPALAIDEWVRAHDPNRQAVDKFMEGKTFPLTEGPFCTFAFRGEADAVFLRNWIYGLPSSQPFRRIAGTDLWSLVLELPEGSRFEYKIEVHRNGHVELIRDPLNPVLAHDPFGANSVCHVTGYETPSWTQVDPNVRAGRLEERVIKSDSLHGARRVMLYFPHRFRPTRRYPLLVVHDGLDYIKYASFKTVLDNLIDRLEIPGMIVALLEPRNRLDEYTASNAHAHFVVQELLPGLERELPLIGTPETRCLMGASLGAVATFHTAVQFPGTFGSLLLQSGSFAFTDIGEHERGPVFDDIVEFVNAYRRNPSAVSQRVFVTCGTYESLIYENRSLIPVLQRAGMDVRYVEAIDGHNWENWRDRLREGLSWLAPGPLWMVYE